MAVSSGVVSPWDTQRARALTVVLCMTNHYASAQRACIDGEIYTGSITFVYRMMVRSYEGLRLHSVAVCPSRARLIFEERF
jgi:hypothetical protein